MVDGAVALLFAGYFDDKKDKEKPMRKDNFFECFMPECLNNDNHFCQCKADNVTPNDVKCGRRELPKESK